MKIRIGVLMKIVPDRNFFVLDQLVRIHFITEVVQLARKVAVRLPGKENLNSHGAWPVFLVITTI